MAVPEPAWPLELTRVPYVVVRQATFGSPARLSQVAAAVDERNGGARGAKFADERWKAAEPDHWDAPRDTHPQLCDACKEQAIETQRQAEQDERERQEAEAAQASKAGGWLGRWRS
ncbi:hypothetical protein [Streptomyces misionensis]|uniref:hypothetical protein n=1 Tax=Streptomyces misionensis TaxID=67331 RepID=UPI0036B1E545